MQLIRVWKLTQVYLWCTWQVDKLHSGICGESIVHTSVDIRVSIGADGTVYNRILSRLSRSPIFHQLSYSFLYTPRIFFPSSLLHRFDIFLTPSQAHPPETIFLKPSFQLFEEFRSLLFFFFFFSNNTTCISKHFIMWVNSLSKRQLLNSLCMPTNLRWSLFVMAKNFQRILDKVGIDFILQKANNYRS